MAPFPEVEQACAFRATQTGLAICVSFLSFWHWVGSVAWRAEALWEGWVGAFRGGGQHHPIQMFLLQPLSLSH